MDLQRSTEIAVVAEASDEADGLEREAQEALYRVAQEALANVAKHAHARHAWLSLRLDDGAARLVVEDDGVGLDASSELIDTIRRVHKGESFIQPSVASKVLLEYGRRSRLAPDEELTEREREVLNLLAGGASNREIGEKLYLAEGTVKNHVSNILGKLHAANRTHAVALAREQGLI